MPRNGRVDVVNSLTCVYIVHIFTLNYIIFGRFCPAFYAVLRSRDRNGKRFMELLDGKTAVITGSSRGLGFAIAEAIAKQGARVVLAARTKKPSI